MRKRNPSEHLVPTSSERQLALLGSKSVEAMEKSNRRNEHLPMLGEPYGVILDYLESVEGDSSHHGKGSKPLF